jgi:hypothetical protein
MLLELSNDVLVGTIALEVIGLVVYGIVHSTAMLKIAWQGATVLVWELLNVLYPVQWSDVVTEHWKTTKPGYLEQ